MGRRELQFLPIIIILSSLILFPSRALAESPWPPFWFDLKPSYQDGYIVYSIAVYPRVSWTLTDVIIKVPIPANTEYVDSRAIHAGTEISFDGQEVTLVSPLVHGSLQDIQFRVKPTGTTSSVFTTRGWISWSGDEPGDYLAPDVTFDITKKPLDFQYPFSYLSLAASASVDGEYVNYLLYPKNEGWLRMWDLAINLPLPEGTKFVEAKAPTSFSTDYDENQVSFKTLELPQQVDLEPLQVRLSIQDATEEVVVTQAMAYWKNEGWNIGTLYPAEGTYATGFLPVRPGISPQLVVGDPIDDVPFPEYDMSSVAFQIEDDNLRIIFYTMAPLEDADGQVGASFTINSDCRSDTGNYGAEEMAIWGYDSQQGWFNEANEETQVWEYVGAFQVNTPKGGSTISMWIPLDWLPQDAPWCWEAKTVLDTDAYTSVPPADYLVSPSPFDLAAFVAAQRN